MQVTGSGKKGKDIAVISSDDIKSNLNLSLAAK